MILTPSEATHVNEAVQHPAAWRTDTAEQSSRDPEPKPRNKGGRPKKSREVANRQTVYLDQARYDALVATAHDHGRSIHSIIIEGIDVVIGRPRKRWGDKHDAPST
ncbi:hypothetical protein [Methylobacterium frigidaeris]|uniref:hypothetical protein n=1 Tax=Methylobacterium frigidaeris TaxID=2038277 RepID=UPI001A9C5191|nr:hypothetical protein [Methylobacterium frigidaeris]